MGRSRRDLSGEERRLWARVARTVKTAKPLPEAEEAAPAPARTPDRVAAKAVRPPASPATPPPKTKPAQAAPVADRGQERKIRRGQIEIAASLDLHGYTQDGARAALQNFIQSAPAPSAVLVITGKGRGGEEGVLRRRLPEWLAAPPLRARLAGFAQAHARHGGAGAYYVLVRKSGADRT
ncbi:MAG: Smr/MutS family protein [Hyphomonadaceae bacterium]